MKVLAITNSLATGGAEKLILETLPFYNEKGIAADLLLLNGKPHPFLEKLRAMNCCQIFSLGGGSVYNPLLAFKIIPYLKRYDVVHVHLFPSLYWTALAKLLSFSKTKLIYTEHSTNNRRRGNFLLKLADKIFYSFYEKIVCISEEVKDDLKRHLGFPDDRFEIIANGVNLSAIKSEIPHSRPELGWDGKFVIIQISSFRYPKDQQTLIRSLKLLPENVALCLVGDGNLLETNKALASELGVSNRVHFTGVKTDAIKYLKTADAAVLSSAYEGQSLSCIEGLSSGKPFMASDVRGLREVVGGAGILFPFGDEAAFAAEIKKLMGDEDYYDKIVSSSMERSKQFDISTMVDSHIALYKRFES